MPTYRLHYFQAKGRVEMIRWIFIQAGVPYEDIRFTQEEWKEFKPKTPFGGMPVLDIDGKIYGGSGPIARYVAEQHGLAGSNPVENFELATISDVIEDLVIRLMIFFYEKDEKKKEEIKKEVNETHVPKYFGILNKRITDNGSSEGWIFGQKVTYVDMYLAVIADMLITFSGGAQFLEPFPAIAKLKASVEALPNIAKWIQERPKTEH